LAFDITFWGAVLAGLISFVSPCVLPIVPPYLCFLAGVSLDELTETGDAAPGARRRIVLTALAFAFGFATVFVALGASASVVGQALSRNFYWMAWVAGGLIILMGLHFLGVIRIPLLYRQARIEIERKPTSVLGAYAVGLAFAFGWTPCVGPVLAAILFTAGAQDTAGAGAWLLFAYSLGMGAPFVLAALFAGPFLRLMRRFRRHMGTVEKVMGVMLVLTGILFITGSMSTIAYWMIEFMPALG
jgi:cytochrome c-type biogenesis protein